MQRRSLLLAIIIGALTSISVFSSTAAAELTVNTPFEYDSPGLTFEAQTVGPTHCKGHYQVNPKKFPATENETVLGPFGPAGGREVLTCRSTNKQPITGNVGPGESFPRLNPEANFWVSEYFRSFYPGKSCFVISLPADRAKGKMSQSGKSYHLVVYLQYDRECH
jgi:hypothetical protein